MKIFNNPKQQTWKELCMRPQLDTDYLNDAVRGILSQVKKGGDQALKELTEKFDKTILDELQVNTTEIDDCDSYLSIELKNAIQIAAKNISIFHEAQRRDIQVIETIEGVSCWRKGVAINKVGIYIPGGSAPLFSTVLMLGLPAQLAGCSEIILCTPPNSEGSINPAILYAAKLVGITKVFKVGGAQAIAAMAYGTESIPQVYKIFGPGNQFVTKAKQFITEEGIAIDMPAGPSEVLVMVDKEANPAFVAADLLSQAEHGADSQVMLVMDDTVDLKAIEKELQQQLDILPRKDIAQGALENSCVISFESIEEAIEFVNEYAPEHLIINRTDADSIADKIINAGSVFLGNYTPESAGDYASGTNHTLPTNGYAKAYAGVSLESFMKYITFQKINDKGIKQLGPVIEEMAEAESLIAHKRAVSVRLKYLNS